MFPTCVASINGEREEVVTVPLSGRYVELALPIGLILDTYCP